MHVAVFFLFMSNETYLFGKQERQKRPDGHEKVWVETRIYIPLGPLSRHTHSLKNPVNVLCTLWH